MGAYSDRVIADGASAYWRLGETVGTTAVDAVGGINGTISGGVTLGAAGALSDGTTAMTFDGATGKVQTSVNVPLPLVVTIEAWIKTAASDSRPWVSTRVGALTGIECYVSGSRLGLWSPPTTVNGVAIVADDRWHHVAYAFTGSAVTFYLDGGVDKTQSVVVAANTTPLAIGWDQYATPAFWTGSLDEVAIYPRALTAPEIAAHYTLARQSVSWPGVPWWVQIQGDDALDNFNVWEPITPSNTVDLPRGVSGGIWVGSGGDVAAVMQNNVMPVVLAAVPTGAWLPIAAKRINATGTTATGLVALYEA